MNNGAGPRRESVLLNEWKRLLLMYENVSDYETSASASRAKSCAYVDGQKNFCVTRTLCEV